MNPKQSSTIWEQHRHQSFPLPKPIINYIIYAKIYPNAHQKLFKSCKYFFAKNPVIIIERLFFYNNVAYIYKNSIADRKLLPKSFPFWITHACEVFDGNEKIIKNELIDRLYHCNVMFLDFHRTILSVKEFLFLSKFAKNCTFFKLTVKDDNDDIIPIEEIINYVPSTDNFFCIFDEERYTPDTAEKLIQILRFSQLRNFTLGEVPEMFHPEIFYKYLKNTESNIRITLKYTSTNLSNAFTARLSKIIKDYFATENLNFLPPIINYPGQNEEELKQMHKALLHSLTFRY